MNSAGYAKNVECQSIDELNEDARTGSLMVRGGRRGRGKGRETMLSGNLTKVSLVYPKCYPCLVDTTIILA